MIYIDNPSKDPYFNLALEDTILKEYFQEEPILILWQNANTIVIGRNQNTLEEINQKKVESDKVNVVRRLSGGGAVFQDEGNLCFTFILKAGKDNINNYQLFLKPIIKVLQKLGLNAEFSGKNDIQIDGKKISGNAQYLWNNRILHHGTILFDVDLSKLGQYLNVSPIKIASKAIKSVQARVTNILPLLSKKITIEEFKNLIAKELIASGDKQVQLPEEYIKKAEKLANEKFRTWEWNYASSPIFTWQNKVYLENKGLVDVRLNIENGIITNAKIYGDFLGYQGTEIIEEKLKGCKYIYSEIKEALKDIDVIAIFGSNFTISEIINLII